MYKLIRIYPDGVVLEGHHLYEAWALEELCLLVSEVHPMSYELTIGLEIE